MADPAAPLSLPQAARQFGVSVRTLRHAIRTGKLQAVPSLGAGTHLTHEWLATAQLAVVAAPRLFALARPQRVPPFARYEGTSAWRKYPNRVRAHARFQAAKHPNPTP